MKGPQQQMKGPQQQMKAPQQQMKAPQQQMKAPQQQMKVPQQQMNGVADKEAEEHEMRLAEQRCKANEPPPPLKTIITNVLLLNPCLASTRASITFICLFVCACMRVTPNLNFITYIINNCLNSYLTAY